MSGEIFVGHRVGTWYWHLVSRNQGCCRIPCNTQGSKVEKLYRRIANLNLPNPRPAFWIQLPAASCREGKGTPLQYSCLENPMDGGAWWAADHGVAGSWTRLSDFTFTFHFHALEKEMATHSSVLAWRIPGTVEPDGLQSMESHRVGLNWSDLAAAAAAASW